MTSKVMASREGNGQGSLCRIMQIFRRRLSLNCSRSTKAVARQGVTLRRRNRVGCSSSLEAVGTQGSQNTCNKKKVHTKIVRGYH